MLATVLNSLAAEMVTLLAVVCALLWSELVVEPVKPHAVVSLPLWLSLSFLLTLAIVVSRVIELSVFALL